MPAQEKCEFLWPWTTEHWCKDARSLSEPLVSLWCYISFGALPQLCDTISLSQFYGSGQKKYKDLVIVLQQCPVKGALCSGEDVHIFLVREAFFNLLVATAEAEWEFREAAGYLGVCGKQIPITFHVWKVDISKVSLCNHNLRLNTSLVVAKCVRNLTMFSTQSVVVLASNLGVQQTHFSLIGGFVEHLGHN